MLDMQTNDDYAYEHEHEAPGNDFGIDTGFRRHDSKNGRFIELRHGLFRRDYDREDDDRGE